MIGVLAVADLLEKVKKQVRSTGKKRFILVVRRCILTVLCLCSGE